MWQIGCHWLTRIVTAAGGQFGVFSGLPVTAGCRIPGKHPVGREVWFYSEEWGLDIGKTAVTYLHGKVSYLRGCGVEHLTVRVWAQYQLANLEQRFG